MATPRQACIEHRVAAILAAGMKRRELLVLIGGAAAWPLAARAQQAAMPVIGFLGSASPDTYTVRLGAFREGLKGEGYVEGQNVAIEYRWAEHHQDRLPQLAAELVQRHVTAIVAGGGTPSVLAAKTATSTIPIVFEVAIDPIKAELVTSLNRPGGNITGVVNLNVEVAPKWLELIRELMPAAATIAVLLNPTSGVLPEQFLRELEAAAPRLGMHLDVLNASSERDFDSVFAVLRQKPPDALVIGPDILFLTHSEQLGALALRHAIPAIALYHPFVAAGGLVSYGASQTEPYRLVGISTGKILHGEKPADLPVQQATKVELIINLKTAKALGLTVPLSVLGRADEVID
jgi:putative ABC transport system substrate-binding protein